MAKFIKEEGIYRCRLQMNEMGNACIMSEEHYPWDKERKCLDESKPLGGLQILLRADAWKVNEDGTLDNERLELNMDNFGVTIITKTEFGKNILKNVALNLARIFGLSDLKDLENISAVSQEKLLSAQFDCRAYKNNKGYLNFWLAPVGEAEPKRGFATSPRRQNRAQAEVNRQLLRAANAELAGILSAKAESPVKATQTPPKAKPAKAPTPPAAELPPRETNQATWTLNDVWERWVAANPDDASTGAKFYEAIAEMYGSKSAQELSAMELAAFVNAKVPMASTDDENMPL